MKFRFEGIDKIVEIDFDFNTYSEFIKSLDYDEDTEILIPEIFLKSDIDRFKILLELINKANYDINNFIDLVDEETIFKKYKKNRTKNCDYITMILLDNIGLLSNKKNPLINYFVLKKEIHEILNMKINNAIIIKAESELTDDEFDKLRTILTDKINNKIYGRDHIIYSPINTIISFELTKFYLKRIDRRPLEYRLGREWKGKSWSRNKNYELIDWNKTYDLYMIKEDYKKEVPIEIKFNVSVNEKFVWKIVDYENRKNKIMKYKFEKLVYYNVI